MLPMAQRPGVGGLGGSPSIAILAPLNNGLESQKTGRMDINSTETPAAVRESKNISTLDGQETNTNTQARGSALDDELNDLLETIVAPDQPKKRPHLNHIFLGGGGGSLHGDQSTQFINSVELQSPPYAASGSKAHGIASNIGFGIADNEDSPERQAAFGRRREQKEEEYETLLATLEQELDKGQSPGDSRANIGFARKEGTPLIEKKKSTFEALDDFDF